MQLGVSTGSCFPFMMIVPRAPLKRSGFQARFQKREPAVGQRLVDKRNAVDFLFNVILHHKVGLTAARQGIACLFQQLLGLAQIQLKPDSKLDRGVLRRFIVLVGYDPADGGYP